MKHLKNVNSLLHSNYAIIITLLNKAFDVLKLMNGILRQYVKIQTERDKKHK